MGKKSHRTLSLPTQHTHLPTDCSVVQDVFFHSASGAAGKPVLREGQRVTYELMQAADGRLYATNIEVVAEPTLN